MPRILVAPDSFKGTYSAAEVADAVALGVVDAGAEAVRLPMADGGEGTLAALVHGLGLRTVEAPACSPWGVPCIGRYGLGTGVAVVEVAAVDGIDAPHAGRRDPVAAGTRGTGMLIADAITRGARHVLVAAGGSATTDGGVGAVAAIDAAGGLRGARITVLADVRTTFADAARFFGPQKGADPHQVEELTTRLHRIAAGLPRDPRDVPGAGAAGGLAGALWAVYSAEITGGADHVLDVLDFDARVQRCDAVVVGEGRLDGQTGQGKAASAVLARCGSVPVFAVVGSVGHDADTSGFRAVLEATDADAMRTAGRRVAELLQEVPTA